MTEGPAIRVDRRAFVVPVERRTGVANEIEPDRGIGGSCAVLQSICAEFG
ncbi:MAG: hypothetical protein JWM27_2820 [Gemmatimonadetes bacterium]|nr:hypothetical protein [Gemmatimonadota bacterium]